jgi:hypothetical protein
VKQTRPETGFNARSERVFFAIFWEKAILRSSVSLFKMILAD